MYTVYLCNTYCICTVFTVVEDKDTSVPQAATALSLLNCYQDDDDDEDDGEGQGMSEANDEHTTQLPITTTTTDTDALVCEAVEPVAVTVPLLYNELPVESSVDMNQESESFVTAVDGSVTSTADVGQIESPSLVESPALDAATPQLATIGHNYEDRLEAIPGECGLS